MWTTEQLYKSNLPAARQLARKHQQATGRDANDCVADAFGILAEVCSRWDDPTYTRRFNPARGMKESSWVHFCIDHGLRDIAKHHARRNKIVATVPLTDKVAARTESTAGGLIATLRADLSEAAQDVLSVILDAPAEIAEDVEGAIYPRLRPGVWGKIWSVFSARGWTVQSFDRAWEELAQAVAE